MADLEFDDMAETRRLAEASAWRVALFEADLETNEGFEAWLAADPRHLEAWRQVSASWDRFGDEAMEPELIVARRDALERARRHRQRRVAGAGAWSGVWNGTGMRIAAALVLVVALGVGVGFGLWRMDQPDVYRTALGERRTITLADGSHVTLDSNSELRVKLRPKARALELLSGQARFEVAHDTSRPFTVRARDKTVVATGTSFNVDLFGSSVIVTLIEGRVSILQEALRSPPPFVAQPPAPVVARLVPGEQLVAPQPVEANLAAPLPPVVLEKVSLDRATAWESGQLVFDNEPLSAVVQRVGRYSDHPLVADRDTAALRLSGVFNAGDIPTFLDAVQRALPVAAETGEDGVMHLRRTDAGPRR